MVAILVTMISQDFVAQFSPILCGSPKCTYLGSHGRKKGSNCGMEMWEIAAIKMAIVLLQLKNGKMVSGKMAPQILASKCWRAVKLPTTFSTAKSSAGEYYTHFHFLIFDGWHLPLFKLVTYLLCHLKGSSLLQNNCVYIGNKQIRKFALKIK